MGKGDKKTRRGKLFSGTFGVRRPKKDAKQNAVPKIKAVKDAPVKTEKLEKKPAKAEPKKAAPKKPAKTEKAVKPAKSKEKKAAKDAPPKE